MPSAGSQDDLQLAKNWKRTLKRSTGARCALIMASIGRGRTVMWNKMDKSRWASFSGKKHAPGDQG